MKDDSIAAASLLTEEHCDRIRDHLKRGGWSEYTIREVFAAIDDEHELDPEAGAWLLELHLEGARRASH